MTGDMEDEGSGFMMPGTARQRLADGRAALQATARDSLNEVAGLLDEVRVMSVQIDMMASGLEATFATAREDVQCRRQELAAARKDLADTVRRAERRVRQLRLSLLALRFRPFAPGLMAAATAVLLAAGLILYGQEILATVLPLFAGDGHAG